MNKIRQERDDKVYIKSCNITKINFKHGVTCNSHSLIKFLLNMTNFSIPLFTCHDLNSETIFLSPLLLLKYLKNSCKYYSSK